MSLTLVRATKAHAEYVVAHMRQEDHEELKASGTEWPLDAFKFAIDHDGCDTWTALAPGEEPVAIGGVTPSSHPYVGVPWAVATENMKEHALGFTRIGLITLDLMHRRFPFLANWVDARNTRHVRWLRSVGFHIGAPLAYGVNGEQFFPFSHVIGEQGRV